MHLCCLHILAWSRDDALATPAPDDQDPPKFRQSRIETLNEPPPTSNVDAVNSPSSLLRLADVPVWPWSSSLRPDRCPSFCDHVALAVDLEKRLASLVAH